MPTTDPTLTELQSATEAQLRAVVDPEGTANEPYEVGRAEVVAWYCVEGRSDSEPVLRRTAKGERWYAAMREMARALEEDDARLIAEVDLFLGERGEYDYMTIRARTHKRARANELVDVGLMGAAVCENDAGRSDWGYDVSPLGRAILSLRQQMESDDGG